MKHKLLIVDDEPLIRKGIKTKIDWNKYCIGEIAEADNGAEAIRIFDSDKYDIVITDIKMPEMDGITLIKELREKSPRCRFAIISGYAEFEFAKKAIALGVEDYILKPVDPAELETVISRIVTSIEDDIKENKENINMSDDNEQQSIEEMDRKLCSVIFDRACDNGLKLTIPESLQLFKFFAVSVLKLKRKGANFSNTLEDNTLQFVSIRKDIKNSIPQDTDVIFFRNYKLSDEFIFIFGFHERNDITRVPEFVMTSVINELKKYAEFLFAAGLGEMVEGLDSLWQSYYQAYYAVCEKMLKGYGKVFSFREIKEKSVRLNLPEEKRRILLVNMQEGNQSEVENYIDQIFDDALKVDNISYNSIKNICEDIYMSVRDFINKKNCNSDIIIGNKFDFSNEILRLDSIEQVRGWIKSFVEFALLNTSNDSIISGKDIVKEVMQYIRKNYNQDITLSYISNKYHINQNYFCRLFKDVAGKSFNKFLTSVRIEKACEMIENSSLKINKIAELIGYSDPKYFSKVFKSETGVTPSEYLSWHR